MFKYLLQPEEKEKRKRNPDQASVGNQNQHIGGVDQNKDPDENGKHKIPESTSSYGISRVKDLRDKLRFKGRNAGQFHDKQAMSDSDVSTSTKKTSAVWAQTKSHSDSETSVKPGERSGERDKGKKLKQKKHYTAFWPLYKKWTENRCYATYEIVSRHVNQLFVRGDNVVSVAIAK